MTAAAVLSFEEARQSYAQTRARQQLHAYRDGWLDSVEAYMPDDTPSLARPLSFMRSCRDRYGDCFTTHLGERMSPAVVFCDPQACRSF